MLNVSFVFLCLFVLSREVHDGKLFRELVQLVEFRATMVRCSYSIGCFCKAFQTWAWLFQSAQSLETHFWLVFDFSNFSMFLAFEA